jgi:nucleoid-associated protein YejK
MKLNFADLVIHRLIAHEVPLTQPKGGPVLSDEDRAPDTKIENFFRQRITSSLNESGIDVVYDPSADKTVKDGIEELLSTPRHLVAVSQTLARRLYDVQNRQNTAGLLVIAVGTIQNRAAVCVLKLEHEEGIRVVELSEKGVHTFNLEYLNNLVLTKRTRVFKVGLFVAAKPTYARISDEQFGRGANRGVADFYLHDFLGCHLATAPEVQTEHFLRSAQEFINEDVTDPEKRARYEQALLAELHSKDDGIRPRQFAQKHIDTAEERHQFATRVQLAGLPADLIPKSLALIGNTIKRIQMSFANGTTITAHPELVGKEIKITGLDDGRTRVEMEDVLKQVKPRA